MRQPLSTYTDGSFMALHPTSLTLIHNEAANTETAYVRIVGFNRGRRARNITFVFNGDEAIYASVQPSGGPQLLVPDLPVYNSGSGMQVHASLRQQPGAWTLPDNLADIIILQGGEVAGLFISNITATTDAQPLLLHIQDSTRAATDIDPNKGSDAIVELYQTSGAVAVDVVDSGHNLAVGSLLVNIQSGIFVYGDVFKE